MRHVPVLLVLALVSCSEDTGPEEDLCMFAALPLAGETDGPSVTDVGLEVQPGEGIVIVATATDPQGSENLLDVPQSVGVFPDAECRGSPLTLMDDLVGSGVEETFGTVVSSVGNPGLYEQIAAAASWPVEVDFRDAEGHRTTGRIMARVIP